MKLFKKKHFVWTEPWCFCQRIRDRGDWFRAIIPALLACVGVSILLVLARGGNLLWWQIALIGLAAGAVVQLGVEAAYMRRDISLDEDSLEAFGNAGQFTSHANYPLPKITWLEIRRSEEIGFPFSMLVLRMETDGGIIGIPGSIRLERLALVLHRLNVPVRLSGWEPPADPTSDQSEHVYSAPEDATLKIATVESVPEIDQNLTKLPEMILALLMAGWLMLAWLGLLIWAGIALYQNRQVLSYWVIGGCAIGMLASLTIPFAYIEIIGDYLSANFLIRIAKNRVQGRGASLIKSFSEEFVCVELIQRATWDAVAPKVVDFGFMQVATDRRQILFEGNKERWTVPFSSVKLCKVEEVQYGTGGESANGQLRCYVVLTFQRDSGPFEIGLRNADKEIGKNTDTRRQRKAVELFDYLVPKI